MKKILVFILAFLLFAPSVLAFDDPKVYMDMFEPKSKEGIEKKQEMQKYKDELKERKLPQSVSEFIKYIKKGDAEVVTLYLDAGMDPNIIYYSDYPIYYAVKSGEYEIVKILLERGARANIGFESPLYTAVKKRNLNIVRLLLQYGADPNYSDFMSGSSILYRALRNGQYNIARELLDSGAKIDTPSMYVIQKKNLQHLLPVE